jgi:hypothetical protein
VFFRSPSTFWPKKNQQKNFPARLILPGREVAMIDTRLPVLGAIAVMLLNCGVAFAGPISLQQITLCLGVGMLPH